MSYPILKPNSTWFAPNVGTITRSTITTINIVDTYTPADATAVVDSWDASFAQDGSIMCYVEGTVLTIAGNGSGKIAANEDSGFMFYDSNKKDPFSALTELNGLSLIDTTNATTLQWAFANCKKLSNIDLSTWNMSQCDSIYAIFYNCTSLVSINLTGWDTSNMTNIAFAFDHCSSLTSLDVGSWDTSNVTTMKSVFNNCLKLAAIDVSNWTTSKVTTIYCMFQSCPITSLDVSKWDTSNITNMSFAFWGCKGLTKLDVENWNVSNVESFDHTFAHCNNLVVDVSNWKTSSKCKYYTCLFHTNANEYLDVSGFDTSGAISMAMMFEANVNLKKIKGLENFDTSNVASFQEMFFNCWNIEELDLSSFDTRKADTVTPVRSDGNSPSECTVRMLSGCRSLKKITLGENFTFAGDGTATNDKMGTLPTQNSTYVENADGNWYTLDGTAYTVNEIPNLTAATYYASASIAKYERYKNKLIDLNGLDAYHTENVKYIDEVINNQVADWNQNDETAADFIKNRPFYEETGVTSIVLFDGDVELLVLFPDGGTPEAQWGEPLTFENGKIYTVAIDDEQQDIVCENNELIFISSTLSDTYALSADGIFSRDGSGPEGTYHIKIETTEISRTLKQLDEKYIPDTIVRISDIPEQVQSDWNQNDETQLDYVNNRTHYDLGNTSTSYTVQLSLSSSCYGIPSGMITGCLIGKVKVASKQIAPYNYDIGSFYGKSYTNLSIGEVVTHQNSGPVFNFCINATYVGGEWNLYFYADSGAMAGTTVTVSNVKTAYQLDKKYLPMADIVAAVKASYPSAEGVSF